MATKKQQIEFVKAVYPAAYNLYKCDSIHPVFVTAQAALETGWKLNKPGNLFGITKGSWNGETALLYTREVHKTETVKYYAPERVVSVMPHKDGGFEYYLYRLFRVYDSMEACLDDHMSTLKGKGYQDAWPYRKDAKEYAKRVVDVVGSKYATDPDYASVMSGVIDTIENRLNDIRDEIISTNCRDSNIFFRKL